MIARFAIMVVTLLAARSTCAESLSSHLGGRRDAGWGRLRSFGPIR
jgi:hypothetical protein